MVRKETVKISFYKVEKCGWYSWGAKVPMFGSLNDVLAQLSAWTDGKDLSETKIADPRGDEYPVYLFGIEHAAGNWAYATWNEVPSHESGVASIKLDSVVGQPQVHMNGIMENSIPGYATYFWAVPQRNVIASIKFMHKNTGQRAMSTYMGRFMAAYSSYSLVGTDENGDDVIIGFTDKPNSDRPTGARPFFKTGVFPKPGAVAYILANHARIRKVIRRGHVTSQKQVDVSMWQSALRFVRSPERFNGHVPVKERVYLELEYTPALEELQEMIKAESEDPDVGGWDDMAFELQGEGGKRHWLGQEAASGEFALDIERSSEETVNLEALVATLNDNANEILKLLD